MAMSGGKSSVDRSTEKAKKTVRSATRKATERVKKTNTPKIKIDEKNFKKSVRDRAAERFNDAKDSFGESFANQFKSTY